MPNIYIRFNFIDTERRKFIIRSFRCLKHKQSRLEIVKWSRLCPASKIYGARWCVERKSFDILETTYCTHNTQWGPPNVTTWVGSLWIEWGETQETIVQIKIGGPNFSFVWICKSVGRIVCLLHRIGINVTLKTRRRRYFVDCRIRKCSSISVYPRYPSAYSKRYLAEDFSLIAQGRCFFFFPKKAVGNIMFGFWWYPFIFFGSIAPCPVAILFHHVTKNLANQGSSSNLSHSSNCA